MKKKLSRSLLTKAQLPRDERGDETKPSEQTLSEAKGISSLPPLNQPSVGGAGSAWKAGAAEQNKAALSEIRKKIVSDILDGHHELQLDPVQVVDRIGSDRREDWKDQEAFQDLRASILENGQDTPIQVWPADVNWSPDPFDPENVSGVQFELITGRRRLAIALDLSHSVRAILAPHDKRGAPDEHFEMLFMRFRENEARENLGPFERLFSVGEMFENLLQSSSEKPPTAVSFAGRIGVHESIVSRGRAIYKARDQILNKFKNAYDMSFPELQRAVSSLAENKAPAGKSIRRPKKITVTRKMGSRKLSLSSQGGKLAVSAAGLNLDKHGLEGLSDVIAAYLEKQGSDR